MAKGEKVNKWDGHIEKLLLSTIFCHYEKLCLWKLHYPTTRCLMHLMRNYATSIPWKYGAFKNKMARKKFTSCIIVTNGIPI